MAGLVKPEMVGFAFCRESSTEALSCKTGQSPVIVPLPFTEYCVAKGPKFFLRVNNPF